MKSLLGRGAEILTLPRMIDADISRTKARTLNLEHRTRAEAAGDRPVILFNLKLQTLRGDFGLPAFPPKSLHYDWLSTAIPAYHVLPRAYTRTVTKPPFLINYSGCLFRTYPGKWQVLLEVPDTDNGGGKYERVRWEEKRPALSELRELLGQELQLDGLDDNEVRPQTQLSALKFRP